MTVSLRRNVVANYLGQGWTALMALVFIPVYIRELGVEAYGVVGVFALMQTWATLLDLGMTPMVNREMARYIAGARSAQSACDLLYSVVVLACIAALALAVMFMACADWIARDWLQLDRHEPAEISRALGIAGVLLALRFMESPYRACLLGLQRHVRLNVALAMLATARWGGAALVVTQWQPSLDAFFGWQAVVSLIAVAMLRTQVRCSFAAQMVTARFSWAELSSVGRFASGSLLTTVLALLLTQSDKLVLTRWLSLEDFGVYSVAWTVASALYQAIAPLAQSYYPRFTGLVVREENARLSRSYHQAAQLLALCIVPPAFLMMFFGGAILTIWWQDAALAERTAPFLSLLTWGVLMNGLLHVPHVLAMSAGWVRFAVYANLVAVVVYLPLLAWATAQRGALGAAASWAILNTLILLFGISFFHRRLLRGEQHRWYFIDAGLPLATSMVFCALAHYAFGDSMPLPWWQLLVLYVALTLALLLTLPALRALWRPLIARRSRGKG